MERLTEKDWKKKSQGGVPWNVHPVKHIDDLHYYKRLAAYEDTGLTPEKMLQIDKDFTVQAKELHEYKKLGYTPEELKLCFNPPNVLYVFESENNNFHEVFPVSGEQIIFCSGDVYWNCRNEVGDYEEIPLSGLHEEYFTSKEEAEAKLEGMENE